MFVVQFTLRSGVYRENGLEPGGGLYWKTGVVAPLGLVTFSSSEGNFDAVPLV